VGLWLVFLVSLSACIVMSTMQGFTSATGAVSWWLLGIDLTNSPSLAWVMAFVLVEVSGGLLIWRGEP